MLFFKENLWILVVILINIKSTYSAVLCAKNGDYAADQRVTWLKK